MPFYDFYWQDQSVTRIGKQWMEQSSRLVLDRLTRLAPSLQHVLEIGPGWGSLAIACAERSLDYLAVDANVGLLRRLDGISTVCALVPPFPFKKDSFDAVVAAHVLEHTSSLAEAQAFVAEMMRVTQPGGYVLIVSPDVLWQREEFWDCDYSHNFATSARRLSQLFVDQGLKVVNLEYIYNHLTGWQGLAIGTLARLLPYRLMNAVPGTRFYSERLHKLRFTFGRAVLIIGQCRTTQPSRIDEKTVQIESK